MMTFHERPKILIVLHQERSSPGRVGHLLIESGFSLDIRRPPLGDPLPDTLAHHAGAVVFGGPMSANDPDEFVKRETDWLSVPLKENRPFLGICLGAQMLVNHLGGSVGGHGDGLVEIGWYGIEPTDDGKALMPWPKMVYSFIARAFRCRGRRPCLPRGTPIPIRHSDTATMHGASSSMPNSPGS